MNCPIDRLFKVETISTIIKMENDMKATTHGTSSSTGHIQFHDRTEQQGRILQCAFEPVKQRNFALDIPLEDQEPQTKFRIVKKAFAIVCQTTMPSENYFMDSTNTRWCLILSGIEKSIVEHIKDVFDKHLEYVCVSSSHHPAADPSIVYIQITLHKTANMKPHFMKRFAGLYKLCR